VLMSLPDDSDKNCVFSDVTNINCVGGIGFADMSVRNQVSQVCMDDEIGCSANF
jgi:hypothetical protein